MIIKYDILREPLLIGCDIRSKTPQTIEIIGNKEVINVNQGQIYKFARILLMYMFQG